MTVFYDSFQIEKNVVQMDAFLERYHFREADRELLWGLWGVLTELLTVSAAAAVDPEGMRAVCMVTLGERYDRLLNLMEESGNLLLGFGMECFGMELLWAGYERLDASVQERTGFVPEGREFPDVEELFDRNRASQAPAGETEKAWNIAEVSGRLGIAWENGMLHPQKSVIYSVPLGTVPGDSRKMGRKNREGIPENKDSMQEFGGKMREPVQGEHDRSGAGGERRPTPSKGIGHDCAECDRTDCVFRAGGQPADRKEQFPFCGRGAVYSYGISRIFSNGQEGS